MMGDAESKGGVGAGVGYGNSTAVESLEAISKDGAAACCKGIVWRGRSEVILPYRGGGGGGGLVWFG